MHWEWNFNLGTILPLIFSAGVFYAITKTDIKALKDNIVEIRSSLARQTETLSQLAVQKAQLESQAAFIVEIQKAQRIIDQRLYDLSRGRGFIQGNGERSGINGGFP
jgi:hypothetical protein